MWWIIWIMLVLIVLIFNYSAGKNNEAYDEHMFQQMYFDKCVDNDSLVFVKYVGNDRSEIKYGELTLTTISTTDNNMIKVNLDDTYILYENFEDFNSDWRFRNSEIFNFYNN